MAQACVIKSMLSRSANRLANARAARVKVVKEIAASRPPQPNEQDDFRLSPSQIEEAHKLKELLALNNKVPVHKEEEEETRRPAATEDFLRQVEDSIVDTEKTLILIGDRNHRQIKNKEKLKERLHQMKILVERIKSGKV